MFANRGHDGQERGGVSCETEGLRCDKFRTMQMLIDKFGGRVLDFAGRFPEQFTFFCSWLKRATDDVAQQQSSNRTGDHLCPSLVRDGLSRVSQIGNGRASWVLPA